MPKEILDCNDRSEDYGKNSTLSWTLFATTGFYFSSHFLCNLDPKNLYLLKFFTGLKKAGFKFIVQTPGRYKVNQLSTDWTYSVIEASRKQWKLCSNKFTILIILSGIRYVIIFFLLRTILFLQLELYLLYNTIPYVIAIYREAFVYVVNLYIFSFAINKTT